MAISTPNISMPPPDAPPPRAGTGADEQVELAGGTEAQFRTLLDRIEGAVDVELSVLALLLDGQHDRHGRVEFLCPICQDSSIRRMEYPRAQTVDAITWRCSDCRTDRTIWHLRRAVLESPFALGVLLENLGVEVVR